MLDAVLATKRGHMVSADVKREYAVTAQRLLGRMEQASVFAHLAAACVCIARPVSHLTSISITAASFHRGAAPVLLLAQLELIHTSATFRSTAKRCYKFALVCSFGFGFWSDCRLLLLHGLLGTTGMVPTSSPY